MSALQQAKWYQNNLERERAKRREYGKWFRDNRPEAMLFKAARKRAVAKGLAFTIEVTDIIIPDVCPVFKVLMVANTDTAPSVDRIDSAKGYTKDNIQVMSKLANRMKNSATDKQLVEFAEWVKQTYTI